MLSDTVRILVPAAATFVVGMAITPILTHYLYKHRMWKKKPGKNGLDGNVASEFNRLHEAHEQRAPRMGGLVVWGSVVITILGLAGLAGLFQDSVTTSLNFLSRNQTWIPLAALVIGGIAGFIDDVLVIRPSGDGLPLNVRLVVVLIMSTMIGVWFFAKLDVHTINIPFSSPLEIGWLVIPFFVLLSLALFASGVIDGIDGLSGGVFMSVFAAYSVIAFAQNQIDLAAFTASVVGGLLAFLWFNIPPARFYMSDTGTMALTLALAVVVFMTDSLGEGVGVAVLPIIGGLLVITVGSNVLQVTSKYFLGKKIFRVAPLHHHFEAIGWPGYKVAMRYWVLSIVFAFLGVILALSAL
ncbi:MAG: Phospho-N-acetylmuramoyl-pentapeptide-transferase [Parcubacteria group bacterium Gr01-1014_8]|nr:MAG: Phospho-N-acetylmuramoyl-pentapeptide-transferase [Parcubacteria group bacterium Gr01-1014_8]